MYELIKKVIESKRFELVDILKKIDIRWLEGDLTDEQREYLTSLAREKANPSDSIDVLKKLEEIDGRVRVLEKKYESQPDGTEEYEKYVVGKWYRKGDKIIFKDKKYECTAPEGVVCTWNPEEYPAYWKELTEEVTE